MTSNKTNAPPSAGEMEDESYTRRRKSRRVSFAETTVHVFKRDESSESPANSTPRHSEDSRHSDKETVLFRALHSQGDDSVESSSEEDENEVGLPLQFARTVDSSSPGSAVCSGTSNDDVIETARVLDEGEAQITSIPLHFMEIVKPILDDVRSMRARERMLVDRVRVITADCEERLREKDSECQKQVFTISSDCEAMLAEIRKEAAKKEDVLLKQLQKAEKEVNHYKGRTAALTVELKKLRASSAATTLRSETSGGYREELSSERVIPLKEVDRDVARIQEFARGAMRSLAGVLSAITEIQSVALSFGSKEEPKN